MQALCSIRSTQKILAGVMIGMMLLVTACGGSPQSQQQASQNKAKLDQTLQHARSIGIPSSALRDIVSQEQQLSSTSVPFTLFNDQAGTDYYTNLATHYQQLEVDAEGQISAIIDQYNQQAQQGMQNFQSALSAQRLRTVGNTQAFVQLYTTDASLLVAAQYPKEYVAISNDASKQIEALALLGTAADQLNTFHNTINQMKASRLDVTAMQAQYQSDLETINAATTSPEFQNLSTLINAQYQEAVVHSIQALPFVSTAKLKDFKTQLNLLKTYGMDASSYQKRYDADQAAMKKASTIQDFLVVSRRIDADIATMHDDLVQGASHYLVYELDREARAWGQAHAYHDKYDGNNYIYTAGYTLPGIGFWFNRELGWTYLAADYQAVVDE